MTAAEYLKDLSAWDFKILATDISTKMLYKASEGRYTKQEVLKVPNSIVSTYFDRFGKRPHEEFVVKDEIKRSISFRRLNLLQDEYPFNGPFDLIVCRNVMIYFDDQTKAGLLENFHRYLAKGGYLFTGHSESLFRYEHLMKRIQVAVYRK